MITRLARGISFSKLKYVHQRLFQSGEDLIGAHNQLQLSRPFHLSVVLKHGGDYEWQEPKSPEEIVNVTYIDKNGKEFPIKGKVGDNVMYLAHKHGIEMEGACEASLACTTCHVYVVSNHRDVLPEATEKEEDLLDLAPFLREDSRLGCQIILNKNLEGLRVQLPSATRNFYIDGHKPKPH
ncbi:adrenodoxin-like protein 1, mitochondrial [Neocloeon triangulifer]|uniref:adrenodoxin-like protein 1, mitochondrial n=1 Tax=Neocloeon triangulifer TaxID=2078957 RepID=UPI00286F8CC7|nr:adrenodoxin-like protein 1, mitochondrial [Neocloeon triangulifer]XP_059472783.1 adrenodoxin-like protein 1, mitochondrial [Neocloeon triangulifer]